MVDSEDGHSIRMLVRAADGGGSWLDRYATVVEDLDVSAMTATARGTEQVPGRGPLRYCPVKAR